ncbi:uncharacterized protein MICPUCDRAFT_60159 [Micromonas pusilla CCMP1545]|uniref:Predicted protein n=2 Tax=Micromonas pusilla TaxID=38833 RepID=C1MXH3_MICPC|nr:uncharacterized protein MICPUCDRAFT_60159 [Micromonas pusilla CCMP1545]EEH55164.1 predicted protein [Micromonas pusilla CCMP1545]|eukprot:XP_003060395.1 predicted protein [Micromonas pusilla CCMP1545]
MATTRALVPRGLPRPPPRTRARRRVPALRRAAPRDACAPEEPHLEDVLSSSGRTTDMARSLWAAALRVGDVAIDATAGNGHDTVALARLVARDDADAAGRVVAYDVQASAVASARARVTRELPPATAARVELRHASHDTMAADVPTPDSVGVVCFNLGYLPGADSDKSVTTTTDATVRAVTTATGLLREGGVVTVVAYVGHDGGAEETAAVLAFCATLDPKRFVVSHHVVLNRKNSPQLVAVHRRMNRG